MLISLRPLKMLCRLSVFLQPEAHPHRFCLFFQLISTISIYFASHSFSKFSLHTRNFAKSTHFQGFNRNFENRNYVFIFVIFFSSSFSLFSFLLLSRDDVLKNCLTVCRAHASVDVDVYFGNTCTLWLRHLDCRR